ncbi:hypothetical protein C1H46_031170 [Malus baccata]|uniref:Uncharacterized protein n=1 Tax=Malus baccata TaxID=106549 RepID=A0A540L9W1_MALBA|nr:hypothetical protein C1H46_031170 [Malus baccata]
MGLSFDDSPINLAAATSFYVLTSDGQDDHFLEFRPHVATFEKPPETTEDTHYAFDHAHEFEQPQFEDLEDNPDLDDDRFLEKKKKNTGIRGWRS